MRRWFKRMRKAAQIMFLAERIALEWPKVSEQMKANQPDFAAMVEELVGLFHRDRDLWRR